MLNPDIFIDVEFYDTNNDGRHTPISAHQFGCIFKFNDKYYDCRLLLQNIGIISPGDKKYKIPLKFLSPELIKPNLKCGDIFYLWEGRNIAQGTVTEIVF